MIILDNNKKLKIRISNIAFDYLMDLLKFHDEYDCVSLIENTNHKCCKSPKINIGLDNLNNSMETNIIDGMKFSYKKDLSNHFKDVTIVLKDSTLYTKATPLYDSEEAKNSSACNKSCSGCNGCKH